MPPADAAAARRALAGVLVFAGVVRLLQLCWFVQLPIAEDQFTWRDSDMSFYAAWSSQVAAGNVLSRDLPRPVASWMDRVAPREVWQRWWGGSETFYNAPLYPYLLAGIRAVLPSGFWGVALGQLVIGLAGVAFIFLIAARLFGLVAAVCAGLAASLYGPALLYECFALRDGLGATTSLMLLWALLGCEPGAPPRRWLLAGVLFAVALLTRETTAALVPFLAVWIAWLFWSRWRALATASAWLVAGAALGLTPLVVRNTIVGAPPLALSSIGPLGLIYGQVADTKAALVYFSPDTIRVLRESEGDLGRALPLIWATYDGDWLRLARNQAARLGAVLSSFEAWDNVNWYYYRPRSPVLRWSLSFEVVLALGIVGLIVERRTGAAQAPLWCFLLASLGSLLVTSVIGRYRLPLASVLLVYAGAALAWARQHVLAGNVRPVALAAAGYAAIVLASHHTAGALERRHRERATEYVRAATSLYQRGDHDGALAEAQSGLRAAYRGPEQRVLPRGYAQLAQTMAALQSRRGHTGEAVDELMALARDYPDDADVELLLAAVYRDAGDEERARVHAEAGERLRAQ